MDNANERPDGGFIVGQVLAQAGATSLFTLCGGHISPILVGAERHGLTVVDTRDEVSAVFAADAAARLTGRIGVAAVTAGPGVTNTVTAVKNAQMAQSPVVVLGGATATLLKGRGSLQDIDQLSIMKPLTKHVATVKTVAAIEPTLKKAIAIAEDGVPGPVFVELPVDLLYPESVVQEWYMKEGGGGKGISGKALELYLRGHLLRQFRAPHVSLELPLPSFGMPALGDRLGAIKTALAGAKRPVLVVGSQTLVGVPDPTPIAQAIDTMGIPTFLAGMARGLLGKEHPNQFRHKRSKALREADVVLVAGFPFDFRLGYGRSINREAEVIAINLARGELTKNRRPEHALCAHPGKVLIELAANGARVSPEPSWLDGLREREQARDREIAAQGTEPAEGGIHPIRLFQRIEEKMADDSVLIVDGGDFVATGAYVVRPRSPLSWLDPGAFGTLGVGGGFAVGAAATRKNSQIWLFYGDGSSAYSLAEVDTFVRHGMAPIAVIGNDGSWAQIARDQVELLGTALGTVLLRCDYHRVAEGYGGVGLLLDDPEKVDSVLDEAIEIAGSGRPVVINAYIGKTDFRKGSLSI